MNRKEKASTGAATPCVDANQKNHLQDNTFIQSSQITKACRQESYIQRPVKRRVQILEMLKEHGPMTAREIASLLNYTDLNAVKPRLTELKEEGFVLAAGKKYDPVSDRRVAVWRAAK